MKRGSIELARSLCEDIEGELEGEVYGSVDVAEILSAEVERLRSQLAEAQNTLSAALFQLEKEMVRTLKPSYAWAPVGKKSGKVLRDLAGQYGVYTSKKAAAADCPEYGEVRRVRITVVPK